ncbi:hypothetical protein QFZ64_000702 [Streptomyces sp. B3I8]|jgi:hypothetical protein|nr:hypothetical protein [Streptomyces sp. B3I8]
MAGDATYRASGRLPLDAGCQWCRRLLGSSAPAGVPGGLRHITSERSPRSRAGTATGRKGRNTENTASSAVIPSTPSWPTTAGAVSVPGHRLRPVPVRVRP